MAETENAGSETVRRTVIDTTLEVRIRDFQTSSRRERSELKYVKLIDSSHEVKLDICLLAFPNGFDENTDGWLVVVPEVDQTCIHKPMNSKLTWIVSLIDIEGESRFPRSFERDMLRILPGSDFSVVRYLEISFILSRADEFLVDGVLTCRCDIYLSWSGVSLDNPSRQFYDRDRSPFKKFFDLLPQRVSFEKDADKSDPSKAFTLFDVTPQFLTSPQFQEFLERFGLYCDPLKLPSPLPKEDIAEILEYVWIFETRSDKFILSLDERRDTVGTRFLKNSSLVRRCVEAPMKERQEKSLVFSDTDGQTLRIVLYFLVVGTLREFDFGALVDVYRFSHLFEMEDLQRTCVEYLTENFDTKYDLEDQLINLGVLEEIADLYSDEYLSKLLQSRREEYENLKKDHDLSQLIADDSPCSNCYI